MKYDCVMLDVGGTYVKHGAVQNGAFLAPGLFPIREDGTAEEIIGALASFLRAHPSPRAAISIPGPMDYPTGESRMKHKLAALYGHALKPELERRLPGTEVVFVHDGAAFLLGEMLYGAARGCSCAAGVMLGTGLGFVMCRDGKVLLRPVLSPARPLWSAPWKGRAAEDFVSGRALRRRWAELGGAPTDVRELSELARAGDAAALRLFADAGAELGEMLTVHLRGEPIERVIIGGQSAKSLDLMLPALQAACALPIFRAERLDDAALCGAYAFARDGYARVTIVGEEPRG